MKKLIFFLFLTTPLIIQANEWKPFQNGFEINYETVNIEDGVVNAWLRYKPLNSYEYITVDCKKKENRLLNFNVIDGIPKFHLQKNKDNIFMIRPNTLGEKIYDLYCTK